MAVRRCPYCKAIIDESQKYCNNCGTQLLFSDEEGEEPIKGEKIVDEDFPETGGLDEPPELIDEPRDEVDLDAEPGEERREIDLEKVIEGEEEIEDEAAAEDQSFVDLREAEPEESLPRAVPGKTPVIKLETDATGGFSENEIKFPLKFETGELEIPMPSHPSFLSKKSASAKEKSVDLSRIPPGRRDHDTKFEIARLIADFEQRRRNYTAELGIEAAEAFPRIPSGRRGRDAKSEITRLIADFEKRWRDFTTEIGTEAAGGPSRIPSGGKDRDTEIEITRLIADFERQWRDVSSEIGTEAADALSRIPSGGKDRDSKIEITRLIADFERQWRDFTLELRTKAAGAAFRVPPGGRDRDAKSEITGLIADFEKRWRDYAAERGAEAADDRASRGGEAAEEPVVPPRRAEVGAPPAGGQIEKEVEAPRAEPAGDSAAEYEFGRPDEASAPPAEETPEEEPSSTDDRLPFLAGSLKKAIAEGLTAGSEADDGTRHPVFTTRDLEEEIGPPKPPSPPLVEKDLIIEERSVEDVAAEAAEDAGLVPEEAAVAEAETAGEKPAEMSGFLQTGEEALRSGPVRETAEPDWESGKTSVALETFFPPAPEGKPEEKLFDTEDAFAPLSTIGLPESVPSVSPPLSFEIPVSEDEIERELEAIAPRRQPEIPENRRPESPAVEVEEESRGGSFLEEAGEKESEQAPAVPEIGEAKAPARAPVVRLGFFRRIKATIFDLLVVGLFWVVATVLAAHFMSTPVLDLIATAAGPLAILYAVLLGVYLFLFLLFLGETPGGRLVTPRN